MRPRIEAIPSVAKAPNERPLSAMHTSPVGQRVDRHVPGLDRARWLGHAGRSSGKRSPGPFPDLPHSSIATPASCWAGICRVSLKATTAASALDRSRGPPSVRGAWRRALISRFGTLGRVNDEFLLRSGNGLVFTSRKFTALVRSYGLKQEFITPHCPQQNGMVERVIRTLKEQCVHRQRFDNIQHATRAIGDWISFCNNRRPHQALARRTPALAFR